jgi:hypothetical protein
MSQASGNKLTGMLSGAFSPRVLFGPHPALHRPQWCRNIRSQKLSGESMSIVGDMGLAVFVLLFAFGMADFMTRG